MEHRLKSSPPRQRESDGSCRKNGGGPAAAESSTAATGIATVDASKQSAVNFMLLDNEYYEGRNGGANLCGERENGTNMIT